MKIHIEHKTTFTYDKPVRESVGELRLRPRDEAGQTCLTFRVQTDPATSIAPLVDRFGNVIYCYTILPPHNRLVVTAASLVETSAVSLIESPPLTPLQRHDFLSPSQYVPCTDELAAFARAHVPQDASNEQSAWALCHAIYSTCIYEPGSTDISTAADAVLTGRRGVCQDFAHLLIALCRCLGLPARYVSGYLHDVAVHPDAVVASHAWVEIFLAGRGWLALDPTHDRAVGPDYVRVALGRDYADATPARGVYFGDAKDTLEVRVRVRAVDNPPQGAVLTA